MRTCRNAGGWEDVDEGSGETHRDVEQKLLVCFAQEVRAARVSLLARDDAVEHVLGRLVQTVELRGIEVFEQRDLCEDASGQRHRARMRVDLGSTAHLYVGHGLSICVRQSF